MTINLTPAAGWPADKVIRWPVERLIPYARNARTHTDEQVAQIAASIREWGWTVPVLVDDAGTLIAGHGRVLAAQRLGLPDIPTIVASGWSDAQKRAYRIADNRLALNAGWDDEMLRLEFAELRDEGLDLGLTGFTADDIAKLLAETSPPDDFAAYDENIEVEHVCPRCGFHFSGGATVTKDVEADATDPD